jgi:hypothetical protein
MAGCRSCGTHSPRPPRPLVPILTTRNPSVTLSRTGYRDTYSDDPDCIMATSETEV